MTSRWWAAVPPHFSSRSAHDLVNWRWLSGDNASSRHRQNCRPGWYPDRLGKLSCVGGTAWTSRRPCSEPGRPRELLLLQSLPWGSWSVPLFAIAVVGLVCFGKVEATSTTSPQVWFWGPVNHRNDHRRRFGHHCQRSPMDGDTHLLGCCCRRHHLHVFWVTAAPSTSASCGTLDQTPALSSAFRSPSHCLRFPLRRGGYRQARRRGSTTPRLVRSTRRMGVPAKSTASTFPMNGTVHLVRLLGLV